MMVPGLYAFETLAYFNPGEIFKARGDYIRLAAARLSASRNGSESRRIGTLWKALHPLQASLLRRKCWWI